MDNNKDFEKLIKKDRDLHQARSWRGNLLGYLDEVKARGRISRRACYWEGGQGLNLCDGLTR